MDFLFGNGAVSVARSLIEVLALVAVKKPFKHNHYLLYLCRLFLPISLILTINGSEISPVFKTNDINRNQNQQT